MEFVVPRRRTLKVTLGGVDFTLRDVNGNPSYVPSSVVPGTVIFGPWKSSPRTIRIPATGDEATFSVAKNSLVAPDGYVGVPQPGISYAAEVPAGIPTVEDALGRMDAIETHYSGKGIPGAAVAIWSNPSQIRVIPGDESSPPRIERLEGEELVLGEHSASIIMNPDDLSCIFAPVIVQIVWGRPGNVAIGWAQKFGISAQEAFDLCVDWMKKG